MGNLECNQGEAFHVRLATVRVGPKAGHTDITMGRVLTDLFYQFVASGQIDLEGEAMA